MDCREIKHLVDRWENGTDLSSLEKESLSTHLQSCDSCRKRYRTLLPFLLGPFPAQTEKDQGIFSQPVPDIAASVMAKIQRLETERPAKAGWRNFLSAIVSPFIEALSFFEAVSSPRGTGSRGRMRRLAPIFALGLVLLIGGGLFGGLVPRLFKERPSDEVTVRFTLEHVNARTVSLVGDFSDWKTYPLQKVGDRWEIQIKLKKGRVYTYNFVVDGEQWVPDPKVPFRVEDGFGGEATLLQL